MFRAVTACALILLAQPLLGQSVDAEAEFRLGVGPAVSPGYFGADETVISPTGSFQLERLEFGNRTLGGDRPGLGFEGAFGLVGARKASDFSELEGLEDIDPSLELGGGLRFSQPNYDVFANLRYGVIGHESLVGELGGDVILQPTEQLELRAGPRVKWGSDDYAQTYFGITAEESAASDFEAFDAEGGILSQGIQARATYQFNDDWGLTGTIRYDQLVEDAADSPITQTEDQLSGSLVVTRKVTFGF